MGGLLLPLSKAGDFRKAYKEEGREINIIIKIII